MFQGPLSAVHGMEPDTVKTAMVSEIIGNYFSANLPVFGSCVLMGHVLVTTQRYFAHLQQNDIYILFLNHALSEHVEPPL